MLNANIPAVPVQTHLLMPGFTFVIGQSCLFAVLKEPGTRVCVFGAHGNLGEVAQGFKELPLLGG